MTTHTINTFLDNELAVLLGPGRKVSRPIGVYFKGSGEKSKKALITTFAADPMNAGCKGSWSAEKIFQESHTRVVQGGMTYAQLAWSRKPGGMRVPRDDANGKGTNFLPPEYRTQQINVSAFNACRAPEAPKLCCVDWDAGDELKQIPPTWHALPHTRSSSGKFHFWFFVSGVPPSTTATNQRLFKPDCWPDGLLDPAAADLFIHQKMPVWEREGGKMFNYDGKLPTVAFADVLEPFLLMEKWFKPPRVSLGRQRSLDPADPLYVSTAPGDPPEFEEVAYLLSCIDPARGRFDGWLQIMNMLKFSCEFKTDDERMKMFDDWSKGIWLHGETVHNYDAASMPEAEWQGITDSKKFGTAYLRSLACATDWGRKKCDAWVRKACIKAALSSSNFDRTPQFGEKQVGEIMMNMLDPHVFDDHNKNKLTALFRQDPSSGVYVPVTMTEIVLKVMGPVTDFLEDHLKGAIARRASAIEDALPDMVEGREKDELEKEAVYLVGLKDADGKVKQVGLLQLVMKQIKKMSDIAACERVVHGFRHMSVYVRQACHDNNLLPEVWNKDAEWVFPFDNGVVDIRQAGDLHFRPAREDEKIRYTCGRTYRPAKRSGGDPAIFPGGDVKKWVMDEIWKIYATDSQVMVKLIIMAASLRGRNYFQMWVVETGSGGNAKGALWKLTKNVFKDLCKELKASALQAEPSGPDAATSYLARLHMARKIGVKEPTAGKKINVATMKMLTGGDLIPCRGLYENETEIMLQSATEMQCNGKPPLDESALEEAEALDRRTCIIVAPFKFNGGSGKDCKPSSNTPEIFETNQDVADATFEILATVTDAYVRAFWDAGVNQIKDLGKLGIEGLEYDPYWEQVRVDYRQGQDPIKEFMGTDYVNMLPLAIRFTGIFDPTKPEHFKSLKSNGDFYWTFEDSRPIDQGGSMSVPIDILYDQYKEFCRRTGDKAKSLNFFRARLLTIGNAMTYHDTTGKNTAKTDSKVLRVFGLGDRDSVGASNLSDSPYDNTMSPSKEPGSHYERILNDSPIKVTSAEDLPPPPAQPDLNEMAVNITKYVGTPVLDPESEEEDHQMADDLDSILVSCDTDID